MNTITKIKCLLLFILMSSSIAFSQVNITTIITPPFSNDIDDYASTAKSNVMLTSTTITMSVYPQVVITGNNGITIKSINNVSLYNSSGLMVGVPTMLTSVQLSQLFDRNKLVVTGMDRTQMAQFIENGTIPNGTYSMCFEAWSIGAMASTKVSNPSPNGCSNIIIGNPTTAFGKSLNEAPKTIMPMCNSNVILTTPQNIVFTWLNPSASFQLGNDDLPKGLQEYILKIVEVVGNKTANEAMKTATTPIFFEKTVLGTSYIYGPADPPLKLNTKYAYTISVKSNPKLYQNNGVSDACMFTCKSQTPSPTPPGSSTPPSAPKYGIVLLDPIQGKKILSGYGLTFSWKPANNLASYYLLQFTDSYSQDKKITDWSKLTDELFTGKNAFYASSPDPSNDAKSGVIYDTKYALSPSWTNGTGKIAWRIVACDKNYKHIDSSGIESYEIIPDTTDLKVTDFMMCGYAVHVLQVTYKDTSKFSCTGEFYLWEGGPKITKQFSNLKLKPFTYYPKIKKYGWVCTDGKLIIDNLWGDIGFKSNIDLEPEENTDGNYLLKMNKLKLVADINCKFNPGTKLFEVIQDKSTSKVNAQLTWQTDWFIWNISNFSDVQYEIQSESKDLDFTFADKFIMAKLFLQKDETIETATKGGISILFSSTDNPTCFLVKGFSVSANLSGTVGVPNSKPTSQLGNQFLNLGIGFANVKNMNFKTKIDPLIWNLNNDGSVQGSVDEVIVHLGTGTVDGKDISNQSVGILVPNFKTIIKYPYNPITKETKNLTFIHKKVFNGGDGFRTNGYSKTEAVVDFDLGGFYAKSKSVSLVMYKNKLNDLFLDGDIFVPFLNTYASYTIEADIDKLREGSIYFDNQETFLIGSKGSDIYFSVKVSMASLMANRISLKPHLTVRNKDLKDVSFEDMSTCQMYISPDGNVAFDAQDDHYNFCSGNQKAARYFKFDYNISQVGIQKLGDSYDYRISFYGDVVLGPKIAVYNKKLTYFDFHGKAPMNASNVKINSTQLQFNEPKQINVPKDITVPKNINIPKGPYPGEQSVEETEDNSASLDFKDDGVDIDGGYEDGAQSFGGKFKIVKDDPVWGDYFTFKGYYYSKEPNSITLSSTIILGKKYGLKNYTYWYVDFFQKGLVTIPVIPAIAEISGFGGKAYYHMETQHDNIGKIVAMVPNSNYSLGIEAEGLFRTTFDEGKTLHGRTIIMTSFNGWSLGTISYYLQGELLAPDDNSDGLLHTRVKAFFNWKDKSFEAYAAAWGDVYGMLCVNGNEETYNMSFKLNKSGIDAWLGTPEDPLTLSVMCYIDQGAWAHIYNNGIAAGYTYSYNSGWKGASVSWGGATVGVDGLIIANFAASAAVQYSPFNVKGNVHFDGTAWGRGCLIWCYQKKASAAGDLAISFPNPFLIKGDVTIDVPVIPTFSICVQWKNGSFSFC